jgi:hypothetical protein
MLPAENWPAYFACDEFNKTFFEMGLQILKDLLPFLFKTPINPSPEEQIQVRCLNFFTAVSYAFL